MFPDHATTGDGMLTALQLLEPDGRHRRGRWPSWPACMTRLPQVLINVRVADKTRVAGAPQVGAALAEAEQRARR